MLNGERQNQLLIRASAATVMDKQPLARASLFRCQTHMLWDAVTPLASAGQRVGSWLCPLVLLPVQRSSDRENPSLALTSATHHHLALVMSPCPALAMQSQGQTSLPKHLLHSPKTPSSQHLPPARGVESLALPAPHWSWERQNLPSRGTLLGKTHLCSLSSPHTSPTFI